MSSNKNSDTEEREISRRGLLQGLGVLGASAVISCAPDDSESDDVGEAASAIGVSSINQIPNVAVPVSGTIAYSQNSVAAGSIVDFHISSTVPYQLTIARLGWLTNPSQASKDWTYYTFTAASSTLQVLRRGSYVHVQNALSSTASNTALTLECWVRPFMGSPHDEGIITQYDYSGSCGFGLFIRSDGTPAFYFGGGGAFNLSNFFTGPTALPLGQWSHVVATFLSGNVALYVNGVSVTTRNGSGAVSALATVSNVVAGTSPLRLGAYGSGGATGNFLDGDLAMPVIYSRAFVEGDAHARYVAVKGATPTPPTVPTGSSVEACWPLDEEGGPTVHDAANSNLRPGTIINHGTWMIGGPSFNAAGVKRFDADSPNPGTPYNPDADATRGHGLRLSQSDLYDYQWPTTASFAIPSDLPSGLYVGRLSSTAVPPVPLFDVPFVVRPAATKPRAPIGVLCATNTWHAYSGVPSFYGDQAGGAPSYMVGLNTPLAGVLDTYGVDDVAVAQAGYYGHLVRAERPLHNWLEQNHYDYDVFSDQDLHLSQVTLSQYKVVFIVGHSEYWSKEMYNSLQTYINAGGKVICASGNTMFWRVSIDNEVIQCRKAPATSGGTAPATVGGLTDAFGEVYHEGDHQRGGLMREAGAPAWKAIGVDATGFGENFVDSVVTDATHIFLNAPESTGAVVGTVLGTRAVGHEFDASISSIAGHPTLVPSDIAAVFARGLGVSNAAGSAGLPNNQRFDYTGVWSDAVGKVINETTDWQRSNGGRVFSTGSITTAATLLTDPAAAPPFSGQPIMGKVFRNALHQMGVQSRLTIAVINASGHFMANSFNGTAFGAWQDLGMGASAAFTPSSPPTGIQWSPDRLGLMALDVNGHFQYNYIDASSGALVATGWVDMGNTFVGRPAAAAWGRNLLNIYARGNNGHLFERIFDGTNWQAAWRDLGAGVASDPAVAVQEGQRISLAVVSAAGRVSYKYSINGSWAPSLSGWTDMGAAPSGTFVLAPTVHAWNGNNVTVFAVRSDGQVFFKTWDGAAWVPSLTGWSALGGTCTSRITVASWGPAQFTIFAACTNGRIQSNFFDGTNWGGWADFGLSSSSEPVAVSYRGGSICIVATRNDGQLMKRTWNGSSWEAAWENTSTALAITGNPTVIPWIFS